MRKHMNHLMTSARRDSWTKTAAPLLHPSTCAAINTGSLSLGEQAVRLARLATIAHMDQAAKLRAMTRMTPKSQHASLNVNANETAESES